MLDQANRLRQLVRDEPRQGGAPPCRPRLVVLGSGKGGVGTTTLAVALAAGFAGSGRRALVVDADPAGGDASVQCGLRDGPTLADVLGKRVPLAESLSDGPAGITLLPGMWGIQQRSDVSAAAVDRLLGSLRCLGDRFDVILADTGNQPGRMQQQFWRAADALVVVVTPEPAAILDTYAAIKLFAEHVPDNPLFSLVNLAESERVARDVHGRLAQACHRFLAVSLRLAGWVPRVPHRLPECDGTMPPLGRGGGQDARWVCRAVERLDEWFGRREPAAHSLLAG